jgi:hypothetical protein
MDLSLHFQAHIEKKGTWSGPEGPIPLFRLHRRRLGRAMPALRPVRTVPCTGRPAAEFTVRVPAPGWLATVNASSTLGSIATVVSYPPDRQLNFPLHITRTALVLLSADAVEATLGNVPSSPPRAARHKLPSRAAPNQIKRPAYRTTRQRSEDETASGREPRKGLGFKSYGPRTPRVLLPVLSASIYSLPHLNAHPRQQSPLLPCRRDDPSPRSAVAVPVRLETDRPPQRVARPPPLDLSILAHTRTTLIVASDDEKAPTTLYVESQSVNQCTGSFGRRSVDRSWLLRSAPFPGLLVVLRSARTCVNVLLIGRKARSCLAKLPAHFRLGSHLYRTRSRTLHVALRSSFSPPSIFFREMALARLD